MQTPTECYLSSDRPTAFLRLETARERLALPYAMLLGLSLSVDETLLELDFASHKVTVKGKRLHEVFCSLALGQSAALFAQGETAGLLRAPDSKAPCIHEIRIKVLEPVA
jgi:hypothetical protein